MISCEPSYRSETHYQLGECSPQDCIRGSGSFRKTLPGCQRSDSAGSLVSWPYFNALQPGGRGSKHCSGGLDPTLTIAISAWSAQRWRSRLGSLVIVISCG